MNKLLTLSAVLGAMLMLAGGPALAKDHDQGHDRGHDRHQRDDGDHGHWRDGDRGHGRGHAYGHYKNWHDRGRHEGWYRRGGYLPVEYRSTRYVVYDWRDARLREPPRGYHWVRSDNGDFLLVAIATGVIVDLLLNQ
ncbi:MAG: RcnB family protein [Rhodanobacter sp.]|jgi:Ni/Co efflux regulator RcnB